MQRRFIKEQQLNARHPLKTVFDTVPPHYPTVYEHLKPDRVTPPGPQPSPVVALNVLSSEKILIQHREKIITVFLTADKNYLNTEYWNQLEKFRKNIDHRSRNIINERAHPICYLQDFKMLTHCCSYQYLLYFCAKYFRLPPIPNKETWLGQLKLAAVLESRCFEKLSADFSNHEANYFSKKELYKNQQLLSCKPVRAWPFITHETAYKDLTRNGFVINGESINSATFISATNPHSFKDPNKVGTIICPNNNDAPLPEVEDILDLECLKECTKPLRSLTNEQIIFLLNHVSQEGFESPLFYLGATLSEILMNNGLMLEMAAAHIPAEFKTLEDKPNALEFTLKLPVSGLKSTEEENDTLTLEHPIQISINGIITFLTPEAVISRPSAIKHSIDTITANLSFIQVKKNLEIKHPLGVYPQASIPELNSPYAVNTPARMQAYKLKDLIINNETAGYQNKSEVGELMFIAGWVAKAIAIKYNG